MKKILISKIKLRWFWYLSAVVVLALYLTALIMYPSITSVFYSDTFYVVCVYAVIDAFALAVGYSMLRKLSMLASWRLGAYLAVIIAGSLAINFFLPPVAYRSTLFFVLAAFAFLALLNFALSKIIFAVSIREACLIGMLVGLVHALMAIMTTPVCNI